MNLFRHINYQDHIANLNQASKEEPYISIHTHIHYVKAIYRIDYILLNM